MTPDEEFHQLVAALRYGRPRPTWESIRGILARAGKSGDDLLQACYGAAQSPGPGDACPKCGGKVIIRTSRRCGDSQVQLLRCSGCEWRPPRARRIVPRELIRPRKDSV